MIRAPLVAKSLRDHARSIAGWTFGLVAIVAIQLAVYPTIRDSSEDWSTLADQFPEAMRKIFRISDYASEVGYLSTELFSFLVPLVFVAIGATWGARLVSEDEEAGTADVLLALPIERREFLASRIAAAAGALTVSAVGFLVTLAVGARMLGMAIALRRFVVATAVLWLLGVLFLAMAAAVGSRTGRRSSALGVATSFAIATFLAYSLAPLVGFFDVLSPWNPMQWTIGSAPLEHGFDWGYAWRTIVVVAGLGALSFVAWERRDIGT